MRFHTAVASALTLLLLAAPVPAGQSAAAFGGEQPQTEQPAEPVRNVAEYHLPKRSTLAIKGYDPVAYFPEHGGKATRGSTSFEIEHKGVTYRFASAANRDTFLANPRQFEPAYGGWCAWAMKSGDKTSIDPKSFIVRNDRLFLFYKGFLGNTKASWEKQDHTSQSETSDTQWRKISGEEPRMSAG